MSKGKTKTTTTTDAVQILEKMFIKTKEDRERLVQAELDDSIAGQIYTLRTQAGLTQKQFAKKIGTTQSVVSQLEDADYEGYSLKTLQRIAAAFHCKVEVNFVPGL